MIRSLQVAIATVVSLLIVCPFAPACSLCLGDLRQKLTFRQEAGGETAKLILYGSLANPRLVGGTTGTTDLRIETVLRSHAFLGDKKVVEIPRYIPVSDPKDPPRYLVFCDIFNNKLDLYRGVPVKSSAAVDYLKGALALDAKDTTRLLLYYFNYLEHADPEIATDAYIEFAKANDQEIGQVAGKLSPTRLRGLIKDPQTPSERLGLYAFLLGGCGGSEDAAVLRSLLQEPDERTRKAFDGMLGGYIHLRPQEGWELALTTLRDDKKPFDVRFAALRTLRFYHGWKPDETQTKVLRGMEIVISQGDLADLAIDDLRRWKVWDLTREILDLYGKKGSDSPILRQAIVRYALSCPKADATRFVAERRKQEPDIVKDVEESLQYEKK